MGGSAHGRFLWYDLMTGDPDGATDFYTAVTGWELQQWEGAPEGVPSYTMFAAGSAAIGGVMELPEDAREEGAPPHWLAYVHADDVDGTTERARELGATIYVEPEDIPTVGRFSVIGDPQGAVIALFSPEGEMEAPDEPEPGRVSWHELATTDHEAAWDFYTDLFGWKQTGELDLGDGRTYRMFGAGGLELGAMLTKGDETPGPPMWTYYVLVRDLDASVATVRERGGRVLTGPMEVPGGDRIAVCTDPQGAVFALHAKGDPDEA